MSAKAYIPSEATIDHMLWRKRYLPIEENKTPIYMYKMVDHYLTVDSPTKNIQAFRGSGKSINTCIIALDRIANGHCRYVLIISDTQTQSDALIADIQTLVEDSTLPIKVVRSVTGEIEFSVDGERCFILGKGAGSSMRGIKRGRQRPDLVITDDLMNDQIAMNRLRMDRLKRWFYKVLMPSMKPDSQLWNVGTPLNQGDIFMHMCKLHPTLKIPLESGVWSDRFTDDWITAKKSEYKDAGMLRGWKQEFELVLADDETQLFNMKKVNFVTEDEVPEDVTWYLTVDLAISQQSSSDYSAFIATAVDTNGRWYVYAHQGKYKPSESASKIMELVNRFEIMDVGIESGATYLAVIEHLDSLMLDYQTWFNITELRHGGNSKHSRIKSIEPVINSHILHIIDNGEDSEALVEQMELTDLEACNASHDDLLDALAYQVQMVPNYFEKLPDTEYRSSYG